MFEEDALYSLNIMKGPRASVRCGASLSPGPRDCKCSCHRAAGGQDASPRLPARLRCPEGASRGFFQASHAVWSCRSCCWEGGGKPPGAPAQVKRCAHASTHAAQPRERSSPGARARSSEPGPLYGNGGLTKSGRVDLNKQRPLPIRLHR